MQLRSRSVGMELVTVAPSGGSIANAFRLSTPILAGGRRFYARCGPWRRVVRSGHRVRGHGAPRAGEPRCARPLQDRQPSVRAAGMLFTASSPNYRGARFFLGLAIAIPQQVADLRSGAAGIAVADSRHDRQGACDPVPSAVPEPAADRHPRPPRCGDVGAGEQPHLGPPRAWPPPVRLLRKADPLLRHGVRGPRAGGGALCAHGVLPRLGGGVPPLRARGAYISAPAAVIRSEVVPLPLRGPRRSEGVDVSG